MNKYVNWKEGDRRIKLIPPQQISDAWHLFKTIMIFALCGAIVISDLDVYTFMDYRLNLLVEFAAYGITWNVVFSLCYNHLFKNG
jgi:hypothetical protein